VKPWLPALVLAAGAWGQNFSERGFLETTGIFYPQAAPNDGGQAIGESLFRYEGFYKLTNLRFAGTIDARFDTHQETARALDSWWNQAWWDRGLRRPMLSMRRLSAQYTRGKLTVEVGKQLIRWGKADVLTPTDRFAPRDFLNVVDSDFLPLTAARVQYGTQSDTIDLVYSPRLTPSRIPLLNQRWAVLPPGIPVREIEAEFPGGPQFGARWNHIGGAAEYSLSFYNGFDHLPLFRVRPDFTVQPFYPQMRMYGADAAMPLGPVTVKGEAAYFTSSNPSADEYSLWVLQLEKQRGEWSLVAGYAGQVTTDHRSTFGFSPERGFTRAVVMHAGYTIDVNRSVAFEGVVRQNGQGAYLKAEYSQAFGQHWRATTGFALIRGVTTDFLGQYRLNSHGILRVRYSF
jgi:hypothetical protein